MVMWKSGIICNFKQKDADLPKGERLFILKLTFVLDMDLLNIPRFRVSEPSI